MYEGDWLRGKPSGKGKFSWPSGATYEGEFRSGRMDGVGTFTGADGDTYHSQWATDRKQGFSSKSYANGDYYEGTWRCNLQGAMGVACGETATSTCVDQWKNGAALKGNGAFTCPDGSCYIDSWSGGDPNALEGGYYRTGAGDATCDVVDSLESSLLCRDESSNASGSLIGTVKRLQSSSAWSTTEAKKPGQTILKGHKNYDLMLNLQLGISYTIRKPSSAQLRELKQTYFDPRKKSWTSQGKEQEKQVFWALAPLTSMSWANVGDDDDDDYYATTAPPQAVWGQLEQSSEGEKKESVGAPSGNRILKKKKSKKEKSSKEQEEHDQNQEKGDIEAEVADATAVDVKERIKKVASMRKKKSSKEMDCCFAQINTD
ncbi:hypothetical protein ZIOFF_051333 [Zingiber officinale]|uniref:Uncharacterized protein n=1 Tax=Zingiber officinale TaxID=94328 RepID=A0A8J5KMV6_ZINOF|nr:hypothetical protein ZIOFF_051333 [Zingiber officinale]